MYRTIVSRPGFLLAEWWEDGALWVFRSPIIQHDSEMFAPVLNEIQKHGLKLSRSCTENDPYMMGMECITERYSK